MSDNQHAAPEEEAGGYGTPTAEQESGGPDAKQFAQPREEEDFDAAGLNQNSPDGETYQTGAPNLDHLSEEDQDSAGEPGAGRFGGTDDQLHAETDSADPGFEPVPRDPGDPPAQPEPGESPIPRDPDVSPVPNQPEELPTPRDPDAAPPGTPGAPGAPGGPGSGGGAGSDVPSADAEIDDSNTDGQSTAPFSSESGEDAAGLPDGSGNNLSSAKAPKED